MELVSRTGKEYFLGSEIVNFKIASIINSNTYQLEQKSQLRFTSYYSTINKL
ncbi:MAG: hypothetical protein K2H63_09055 [Paramuribaculum sp.]|nr:hypothetical protein [Paramuribaculum sp.]